MPKDYIKDEKKWNDAKSAFKKQYSKDPSDDKDWAIVMHIYKQMGGRMKNVECVKMWELFNDELFYSELNTIRESIQEVNKK